MNHWNFPWTRIAYKLLRKSATDSKKREIYDSRQGSLKWIGVVSIGYLGHSNSKFGRIDGHIAVCAFDRHILKQACRIAEAQGFRVLHGIVDSLWVKKRNATKDDYLKLKQSIEQETRFEISFEGVYKWIAFVHSKQNVNAPVPNRYFGVFKDGNVIKDRGIETRRHDTPPLFSRFQSEILSIMAQGDTIDEVRALMPKVFETLEKYKEDLRERRVTLTDLVFTKMLSKDSNAHFINTVETSALSQLVEQGGSLRAGQVLRYIVADYHNRRNPRKRTVPIELINDKTQYDVKRYIELLVQVCHSVTQPFMID